jgi:hypothetical protein
MNWIHCVLHKRLNPVIKILGRDKILGVDAIGTQILYDCVHPLVMVGLFLAKGVNDVVETLANCAFKCLKSSHQWVSDQIRITHSIIHNGQRTCQLRKIPCHDRNPHTIRKWRNIDRKGIVLHPIIRKGIVGIKGPRVSVNNCRRRRDGKLHDGIMKGGCTVALSMGCHNEG